MIGKHIVFQLAVISFLAYSCGAFFDSSLNVAKWSKETKIAALGAFSIACFLTAMYNILCRDEDDDKFIIP